MGYSPQGHTELDSTAVTELSRIPSFSFRFKCFYVVPSWVLRHMPDFNDHHHGLPERFTSASYFNAVPHNSTLFCIISHFHKHLMTDYASAKLKLGDAFLTYFCVFDQNVTSQGSLF